VTGQDLRLPALVATNPMDAGLGNRIRFTLSCDAIAESEGRAFYYHWPTGDRFGAKLTELWEYPANELDAPGPQPYLVGQPDLSEHKDEPVISLRSYSIISGTGAEEPWADRLRRLRPVPKIAEVADGLLRQVGPDFVGVQVRAFTGKIHAKTLEASPVSWFIDRMTQLRAESPDTRFFLSCDEPTAQQSIIAAVPGTVALQKTAEHETKAALLESVVDLLVLARSRHILAPYWSSFAELAWALSGYTQDFETSRSLHRRRA